MVEYPCEPGRWVYRENSGLWGMGARKVTKSPLFWLQRTWCCIPLRLVFTLQDRISGDLDPVWLEALWKGYRGYGAAISGKLWLSGKHAQGGKVTRILMTDLDRQKLGTTHPRMHPTFEFLLPDNQCFPDIGALGPL